MRTQSQEIFEHRSQTILKRDPWSKAEQAPRLGDIKNITPDFSGPYIDGG
jgi:hypothetical protein